MLGRVPEHKRQSRQNLSRHPYNDLWERMSVTKLRHVLESSKAIPPLISNFVRYEARQCE